MLRYRLGSIDNAFIAYTQWAIKNHSMHDSPMNIEELSRRFDGQQRLHIDIDSGAGKDSLITVGNHRSYLFTYTFCTACLLNSLLLLPLGSLQGQISTASEYETIPDIDRSDEVEEEPPETAARPPRPGRLVAVTAVEDDTVHTITPVARSFQAGRRRQRRIVSPSPFVLQQRQVSNSAGGVAGGGHAPRKISSVPLGPSKRKLHMSPFSALDDIESSDGNRAARRRVIRRKVSISDRRRSASGTPMIPRRRSFLAPSRSSEPPASQISAIPLRTSIANSPS